MPGVLPLPLPPPSSSRSQRVSSNSLLLRFIEIGRGGWLPSVKSRRKWGSVECSQTATTVDPRRDIRETEAHRDVLANTRADARRSYASFPVVARKSYLLAYACETRECRLYVSRNDDWAIRLANSR